jgi:hypothetical protein
MRDSLAIFFHSFSNIPVETKTPAMKDIAGVSNQLINTFNKGLLFGTPI